MRSNMTDLTGQVFGKWKVIQRAENNSRGASVWLCECECGTIKNIVGSNLRTGRTSGCYSCSSSIAKRKNAHKMTNTKVYKVWRNMKARCYYPKDKDYKNYGARGIFVCEEWKNNFVCFYEYVSKLPHFNERGYTLDRINVNGNYEPNNVRWATRYEQIHNRRK